MDFGNISKITEKLNVPGADKRLAALKDVAEAAARGEIDFEKKQKDVNNHIHTIYSFSPYSPTAAVFRSRRAGLVTTGIMDHDSISGAREFISAGKLLKIPTTIGAELRADFSGTKLCGKRINNPDQDTVAYIAMHGIPHTSIDAVAEFFKPVSTARGKRNREMANRINTILSKTGINIDYDDDVLPLSMHEEGGSVTERHLLFAVAKKITTKYEKGTAVIEFLENVLDISVKGKAVAYLSDPDNESYEYDLLNVLKGNMVEKFYIPATDEAIDVKTVSGFAREHGIILAYAYLGDVTQSVTGDKKAQKFEDDYIEQLFDTLKELGFNALTYMPSRNTPNQLSRLRRLCNDHGFFQISGEDINQPRQKFICEAMRKPEFSNLYDAAWALIGHENMATENKDSGMFSRKTIEKMPDLNERIEFYKKCAMENFEKTNI